MTQGRIFGDDWRACLREQYKYVIRQQDSRTEATLTDVLYEVGFSADELAALRLEATMRDMPDDYVPEEVQAIYAGVDVPEAEPVVEETAMVIEAVDAEDPEEEIPVTYDELVAEEMLVEAEAEPEDEELEDDSPDSPQQMSLF